VGAAGAGWIHGWFRRIVRALGLRCEVEGRIPVGGAVVSNHLSYLDILLYSSVQPFVMVAKTEVRGWPLLGWLTAQAGTVYVRRGGGPTTDGEGVLPFRRGLFHSVLDNGVSLRTAGLRYTLEPCSVNRRATVGEDVCWWGEMGFTSHMFVLLGLRGLKAQIRFGDEVVERRDRFILSETAQAKVVEMYEELGGAEGAEAGEQRGAEVLETVLS
jgi:hypothetical protein